jgi:WD40 repeat protein
MNASESTATAETIQNPFPGLRPYEQQEADLFFGRDDQIQDLVERLRRTRFVAVVGSSGCGKSSLVRAGILPMFACGFLGERASSWRIAVMRPGNNPLANLAEALTQVGINGVQQVEAADRELAIQSALATLRSGQQGILTLFQQAGLPADAKLLVLVDQFEELFRFADPNRTEARQFGSHARMFVNLLLAAAQQAEVPIYVMLTMRSEFLADCTSYMGLPEAVNEGLYLVPRLTRDQLRDAIEEPLRQAGSSIQNRLVNELLNNLGSDPDQLPIMQHALMRLWDQHAGSDDPIDLTEYEKIGGVQTALEQHLQEIYDEEPQQQATVKALFRELARVTDDGHLIRHPRTLDELSQATGRELPELIAVIERFRQYGRSFLTPPPGVPLRGETIIDISHESLIRHWKDLRQWVVEDDAMRRVEKWLVEALGKWNEAGRADDDLLTGERLEQARSWLMRKPHRAKEKAYIDASLKYRDLAARLRIWGKAAWVIMAVMLVAFVSIFVAYRRLKTADVAKANADRDRARAKEALANAERDRATAKEALAKAEREKTQAEHRATLEKSNAEKRSRLTELVGYNVKEGAALLQQNDNIRSLDQFAKAVKHAGEIDRTSSAAKFDSELSTQLLRFASVLRQCPRLECAFGPEPSASAPGGEPKRPAIYLAQFVKDGRCVATASDDGRIRVWDPARLDARSDEFSLQELVSAADEVSVDAISATGKHAAVHLKNARAVDPTGRPEKFTMSWLVSLHEKRKWPLNDILLRRAKFTPDEKCVVTYGQFGTEAKLNLWPMPPEAQPLASFEFYEADKKRGPVKDAVLEIDEGGRRLFGSFSWLDGPTVFYSWPLLDRTSGGRIAFEARTILSAETPDPPATVPPQVQLRILPSGRLLSCSADGTLFLTSKEGAGWKSTLLDSTYSRLGVYDVVRDTLRPAEFMTTRLSPDGRWLATSLKDSQVSIHTADAVKGLTLPLLPIGSEVKVIDFSPDAARLLTAGADGRVKVWNVAAAVTPDKLIDDVLPFPSQALETPAGILTFDDEGQLQRRGAIGDEPAKAEVPDDAYQERWLALSPQATRLMTCNGSRQIAIHDLLSEQTIKRMPCQHAVVAGRFLAGGWAVCVWDAASRHEFFEVATGRPIAIGNSELPLQLVVSENGQCVAYSQNGDCGTWNVKQAAQIGKEFRADGSQVKAVCNDGRHIVLARPFSPVAELWRIGTEAKQIAKFEHQGEINYVAFSNDDKYFVTCSDDKSAKVWAFGGTLRGTLSCGDIVMFARFSQDSRYVATVDLYGKIQAWDAQTGQLLAGAYQPDAYSVPFAWYPFGPDVLCVRNENGEQIWTWNASVAIENQDRVEQIVELAGRMNDLPGTPQNWAGLSESMVGHRDRAAQDQWHRLQASICRRLGQWEAVVWHLNKCSETAASSGSVRALRGMALAKLTLKYNDSELWDNAERALGEARQALSTAHASPWLQAKVAADSIEVLTDRAENSESKDSAELRRNVLDAAYKIASENINWQTLGARTRLANALANETDFVNRAQELLEQNLDVAPEDVGSQFALASIYNIEAQTSPDPDQRRAARAKCANLLVKVAIQDPTYLNGTREALKQLGELKKFTSAGETVAIDERAHSLFSNCLRVQERAELDECVALYVQLAQVLMIGSDARAVEQPKPLDSAHDELRRVLLNGDATEASRAAESGAQDLKLPTAVRRSLYRTVIDLREKSLASGQERPLRLRQLVDTYLDAADLQANESEIKAQYLHDALKNQEELTGEGSFDDDDRRRLARVYVALGYVENAKLDYGAALKGFEEARKLRAEIVAAKDSATSADVENLADSLEAIAGARIGRHETAAARKLYHECEALLEHELLALEDQNRAEIFVDLGQLSNYLEDYSNSNKSWLAALKLQEKRALYSEPGDYVNERLAYIKEWLADVERKVGHTQEADRHGKEGVDLREKRLAAAQEHVDRKQSLAAALKWWAYALDRVGKSEQAIVAVDKEIELRRAVFADRGDQASHLSLIDALSDQGDRHTRTRQLSEAIRFYEEARQEAEKCWEEAPVAFKIVPANRHARAIEDLASIDRAVGEYTSAADKLQTAFDLRKKFEESEPNRAAAYVSLADGLARVGRLSESLEASEDGMNVRAKLFEIDPENPKRRELASARTGLARSQLLLGDFQKACHLYDDALAHWEEFTKLGDSADMNDFELRRRQAEAHASIAHQSQVRGLFTKAKDHYRQAVGIYRQLSLDDSQDADAKAKWRDAAFDSAHLALRLGDPSASAAAADEALTIARALTQLDKPNTSYQRSLASSLELMAKFDLENDRPATSYLNEAIAILKQLTMSNPSQKVDSESLERVSTRLTICELVEMQGKIEEQTDDVKREWAYFQAEKLTGMGNYELALEKLKGLQQTNDPLDLFKLARCAARCAWIATRGTDVSDLRGSEQQAYNQFCQQSVSWLKEAVEKGFKSPEKFLEEDIDLVRSADGYAEVAKALEKLP